MRKTILTITTALSIGSAFAAPTNNLRPSSSASLLDINTYKQVLKDTSFSYYIGISNDVLKNKEVPASMLNVLSASYKINEDVSFTASLRHNSVEAHNEKDAKTNKSEKKESSYDLINPRFQLSAFKYTNGDLTISPSARLEVEISDKEKKYGVFRLAQSTSYQATPSLSFGLFSGLYETITTDKADAKTKDNMSLLFDASVAYSFTDAHSLSMNYEMISSLNEKSITYTNKDGSNTLYLNYVNTSIKNVSLSPGLYIKRNVIQELADNVGAQVQVTITM